MSSLLLSVIQEPTASIQIASILAVITTAVTGTVVLVKSKKIAPQSSLETSLAKIMETQAQKRIRRHDHCLATPADCWCSCVVGVVGTGWVVWFNWGNCSRAHVPWFIVW